MLTGGFKLKPYYVLSPSVSGHHCSIMAKTLIVTFSFGGSVHLVLYQNSDITTVLSKKENWLMMGPVTGLITGPFPTTHILSYLCIVSYLHSVSIIYDHISMSTCDISFSKITERSFVKLIWKKIKVLQIFSWCWMLEILFLFYAYVSVYLNICLCTMCMHCLRRPTRPENLLGLVTDGWCWCVGTRNWTLVLWKSSQCSGPLSHISRDRKSVV